MGFFEHVYGSWSEMQDRKYAAVFSILRRNDVWGNAVDVGSGRRRGYPFPTVRVDSNPLLFPDVVASGSMLPFLDSVFEIAISVDSCHLFDCSELFRVARHVAIALPERLYKENIGSISNCGVEIETAILVEREKEIITLFRKKQ